MRLYTIARIYNEFPSKFGIPRQSGLVNNESRIIFEQGYAIPQALRGLEDFSYIWLLWGFSGNERGDWSPTVRPPRLGGNERMGVFATRSPNRPNPLGLSSVKLLRIDEDQARGMVLIVEGADMMNGTPIYDIKPYLPHVDSHPLASAGFVDRVQGRHLEVVCPQGLESQIPPRQRKLICDILSQDPRPAYHHDPERIYGMEYGGLEIRFRVEDDTVYLCGVEKCRE